MTFDLYKCPKNEQGHWLAQTNDGRKVRILCADVRCDRPLVGVMDAPNGNEVVHCWLANGLWSAAHEQLRLINTPTKHGTVVEVWRRGDEIAAGTPDSFDSDFRASNGWHKVTKQKIEWEE